MDFHARIANHAGDIAGLFKPGAKVTVLVRSPGIPDADVLVTDDSVDAIIAALEKLRIRPEQKLTRARVLRDALDL